MLHWSRFARHVLHILSTLKLDISTNTFLFNQEDESPHELFSLLTWWHPCATLEKKNEGKDLWKSNNDCSLAAQMWKWLQMQRKQTKDFGTWHNIVKVLKTFFEIQTVANTLHWQTVYQMKCFEEEGIYKLTRLPVKQISRYCEVVHQYTSH